MYFTSGSDRAFESLMQGKPGFDHYDSGDAGAPEDCGDCRFYRPDWKYQFCVYAERPYQPGKLTALDAVKFQVKGVDDEMAVFRVEKNRGYTVMSNHHLREQRPVPESQGPAFANAVPAGRLGLARPHKAQNDRTDTCHRGLKFQEDSLLARQSNVSPRLPLPRLRFLLKFRATVLVKESTMAIRFSSEGDIMPHPSFLQI